MITIVDRSALQLPGSPTSRFEGADHSADVSMFWVHTPPGNGPDFHWHPYTETWVVLHGEVRIEAGDEQLLAQTGNIVTVPAKTNHRFRSVGRAELEMLCIHASPTIIQGFVTPPPSPR
ncbi:MULTISPECIES: cupin domain-containing protein [Brevibacterium]|uniref:Cupin 2 conserved barrel domain protein n=1 Tax=Brevibacterium linens TaxID=1703 RepID=A0A0B9AEK0_BRELN|nr:MULTISPECIES: cupin domain-containing protein [Brevibacterium]KHS54003.1 Cupin 2 conserved barrel domain protein [Brevibacterium linens]